MSKTGLSYSIQLFNRRTHEFETVAYISHIQRYRFFGAVVAAAPDMSWQLYDEVAWDVVDEGGTVINWQEPDGDPMTRYLNSMSAWVADDDTAPRVNDGSGALPFSA